MAIWLLLKSFLAWLTLMRAFHLSDIHIRQQAAICDASVRLGEHETSIRQNQDLSNRSGDRGLLIHILNGISVLYHAQFLYDVQNHDGNKLIANVPEEYED